MQGVLHVQAFEDNYIWLIRGNSTRQVAVVDPGDAAPLFEVLPRLELEPIAVLCTHHHGDHTGGIEDLRHRYPGLPVYGPDRENIAGVTHPVRDGDHIDIETLGVHLEVLGTPGHTRGHLSYYGHSWLFCGDTLFSAGCGRLFEGTAAQMYQSLSRLAALPPDTLVYCAHEYTQANLRFAVSVEPDNPAIRRYRTEVENRRQREEPTVPSTLGLELEINPFLRSHEPAVRLAAEKYANKTLDDDISVFAAIRRWKDNFR